METSNRRRFTRLPFQKEALLKIDCAEYQVKNLDNLSIGGCLLEVKGPLNEGEKCTLVIPLHHTAPDLQVDGEIIRSDTSQTTIRFSSISPENLVHLQNIIRYNADSPDVIDDEIKKHPGLL